MRGPAKGRHGNEGHLPAWRSGALALEGDPNLGFEHRDAYWRKVHGPEFAWDEPGSSSAGVLRYDQVHRLASGRSSGFPPPYRAMVDEDGLLPSDPWKRVPGFKRPRREGLAYIANAEEDGVEATPSQDKFAKRIVADEQTRSHDDARDHARAYPRSVRAAPRSDQPDQDPQARAGAFPKRLPAPYAGGARPPGAGAGRDTRPGAPVCATAHYRLGQPDSGGSSIDAVSLFAFASLNDVEDYLVHADHAAIAAWEAAFAGEGSEWWTAVNYSVVNRLAPEVKTDWV